MNELVSGLLHLTGAGLLLVGAPGLRRRLGDAPLLRAGRAVHLAAALLLLVASGTYHCAAYALGAAHPTTGALRLLDHVAVWLLIGGLFTLPHLLAFRSVWRWGPLAAVWLGALAGAVHEAHSFGSKSVLATFALPAGLGLLGVASVARLAWERGLRATRWVLACYGAFALGSVFFLWPPPDLVPGLVGAHELWHVGVLLGIAAHDRFVHDLASGAREAPRPGPATGSARAAFG
ncbi:MAG: hypothetical protein D6731_07020 [Planctomycetota bacterium]|nr:MAG: hypothetical protein D6731_07020 [Planctomycetota bacterium]